MDLSALLLPSLGAYVSHVACVMLVVYVLVLVPYFDVWIAPRSLTLPQVKACYQTRNYRGRPAIPLATYKQLLQVVSARVKYERFAYVALGLTSVVLFISQMYLSSTLLSFISNALFLNPLHGAGVAAKIAYLVYRLTRPGISLASALATIAIAWSYSFVRIGLCAFLLLGFSREDDNDICQFSWAFFPLFRVSEGVVVDKDGGRQVVYFFGPVDPSVVATDEDPAMEYSTRQLANIAATRTLHNDVYDGIGLLPDDSPRAPALTIEQTFASQCFQDDVPWDIDIHSAVSGFAAKAYLLRGSVRFTTNNISTIPVGVYDINVRYKFCGMSGTITRMEVFGTVRTERNKIVYTGTLENSTATFGTLKFTPITPAERMTVASQYTWEGLMLCDAKCVDGKWAYKVRSMTTEEPVSYDFLGAYLYTMCFPLGYQLSLLASSEFMESLFALLGGLVASSSLMKFIRRETREDVAPEGTIQCHTCNKNHMTLFCSRNRSAMSWISWTLNGAVVLGGSLLMCLATSKGFNNIRAIARALRYGVEHLFIYESRPPCVSEYCHVSPACPTEPAALPALTALLEMTSNSDAVYHAKKNSLTAAVFNQLVVTLKQNPDVLTGELFQLATHVDGSSDPWELDAIKFKDFPLYITRSGAATGRLLKNDSTVRLSVPFPGGFESAVTITTKARDGGIVHIVDYKPFVSSRSAGVTEPPCDPETTVTDLFILGWSVLATLGVPVLLFYVVKKLTDRNVTGSPCSVCGEIERDHFDGACIDFPQCHDCGTKKHRKGNCSLQPEGASGRICKYAANKCTDASCGYTHRAFSVLNRSGCIPAVRPGDKVVCLHMDKDHVCAKTFLPPLLAAKLTVDCHAVSINGAGKPTGSISVPPADIYYTSAPVYSSVIALLNLRSPEVEPEGRNDPGNSRYATSARSIAHREDRGNRGSSGYSKRRRDTSKVHGSETDVENILEFISNRHDADEWRQFVDRYAGGRSYRIDNSQDPSRWAIDALSSFRDDDNNLSLAMDQYDAFMEEAARLEPSALPQHTFCHDFVNFRCRRGQTCPFPHKTIDQIEHAARICPYGSRQSCIFPKCALFSAAEESATVYNVTVKPPQILTRPPTTAAPAPDAGPKSVKFVTRTSEHQLKPEASIRGNPAIAHPASTPIEVHFGNCALYAWKTSENFGLPMFVAPYHLFQDTCPAEGDERMISAVTTVTPCKPVTWTVRVTAITCGDPPTHNSNAYKTAMCALSVVEGFRQADFPGLKCLTLTTRPCQAGTAITIYPPISNNLVSSGVASATGDLITHNISLPERFNGVPILRCGRLLVGAEGPVGFHVAGSESAQVNYAFPISKLTAVIGGHLLHESREMKLTLVDDMQSQGTKLDFLNERLRLGVTLGSGRAEAFPSDKLQEDVLGHLADAGGIVGTCNIMPPPRSSHTVDPHFLEFMRVSRQHGKHVPVVQAFEAFHDRYVAPVMKEDYSPFAAVCDFSGDIEAMYSGKEFFTHLPARLNPMTMESNVFKFFRVRNPWFITTPPDRATRAQRPADFEEFEAEDYSTFKRVCFEHYVGEQFRAINTQKPYTYASFRQCVLEMEDRGSEYRSAGAGVTKNEIFRDPDFEQECDRDDHSPSIYTVGNKVEMRTIGKDMRQFFIQDPLSYAKEVRLLRWFVDALIDMSQSDTHTPDCAFFNTFSPFGDPNELIRRATVSFGCHESQLWFTCYDAKKSECNDFEFVAQGLGALALDFGAPLEKVAEFYRFNKRCLFVDQNVGRVYQQDPDCVMFNGSGAFHTTLFTSAFWTTAGGYASDCLLRATAVRDPEGKVLYPDYGSYRSRVFTAGDDGVLVTNFDPTLHMDVFLRSFETFGGAVEADPPMQLKDAPLGRFNFCSVTFSDPSYPSLIPGKKTSSLVFQDVRATPDIRLSALDSYYLTSIYDPVVCALVDDYRDFYAQRHSLKSHKFLPNAIVALYSHQTYSGIDWDRFCMDDSDERPDRQILLQYLSSIDSECVNVATSMEEVLCELREAEEAFERLTMHAQAGPVCGWEDRSAVTNQGPPGMSSKSKTTPVVESSNSAAHHGNKTATSKPKAKKETTTRRPHKPKGPGRPKSMPHSEGLRAIEARLRGLEKDTQAEREELRNASRAMDFILCPDQLESAQGALPVLPLASTANQFNTKYYGQDSGTFGTNNLVVTAAGQHSLCFVVTNVTSNGANAGELFMVNLGQPDLAWPVGAFPGVSTSSGTTNTRMIPDNVSGFMMSVSATSTAIADDVPVPTPTIYTGNVWYLVRNSNGTLQVTYSVFTKGVVLIGGACNLVPSQTVTAANLAAAVTFSSRYTAVAGVNSAMTLMPFHYTNGEDVRAITDRSGTYTGGAVSHGSYAGGAVANNTRFRIYSGLLASGVAFRTWVLVGGDSGPVPNPSSSASALTSVTTMPFSTLDMRCNQATLGALNVTDKDWCGCNIRNGIASVDLMFSEIGVQDLSYMAGMPPMDSDLKSNCPDAGWGSCCSFTITYFQQPNGIGQTTAIPFTVRSDTWFCKFLPPSSGLPRRPGKYSEQFAPMLQESVSWPGIASYHSFKDYFASAAKAIKDVGMRAGKAALGAAKEVVGSALLGMLL